MFQAAWVLARKDLKLYMRDRTALLLSLLMPICLATIFGAAMGAMGGGNEGLSRVTLLVEDLDGSTDSKALASALERSNGLKVEREEGSRKKVSGGKAAAALLIPSGYGEDLRSGRKPQLKLFRDPSQSIEQQIIAASLMPALVEAGGRDFARGMMRRGLSLFGFPAAFAPQADLIFDQTWDQMHTLAVNAQAGDGAALASDGSALNEQADTDPSAVTGRPPAKKVKGGFTFGEDLPRLLGVETEDVAGGADKSQKTAGQAHAVSGIAVMMLLFGLVACGGTLLEEQASGTLQRLQLSPSSGSAILAGKFLFTAIAGSMQLTVLFLFGSLVFSVPVFHDPLAVLCVSLAVVCAATGLGLFLAVTCRTRKQLDGLSTLIILVMSALGGSWFPLIVTPEWYQRLGHFTLNAWAMDAYQGIFWYGKGLSGVWIEIAVLLAIGAALSLLARRGWKRRFEISG
jgi:ABC-2 type transport system permease protein